MMMGYTPTHPPESYVIYMSVPCGRGDAGAAVKFKDLGYICSPHVCRESVRNTCVYIRMCIYVYVCAHECATDKMCRERTPTNYLQCDTEVYGHGRGNGDGQDNGDGRGNGDGNGDGDGNNSGQILSWRAGWCHCLAHLP